MTAVFAAVAKAALILPVSEAIGQLKWVWVQEERKLFDFLTFDNASRGPLGSFLLLGTTRCRFVAFLADHSSTSPQRQSKSSQVCRGLISMAAAITVCALAFEPFFQQSVSYPSRDLVSGNGTIHIANSYGPIVGDIWYNVPADFVWAGVGINGGAVRSAALEVANAIANKNEPVRSAPSLCPTGRCTWKPYSTLAVCNRCQDMSHLLVPICQRADLNQPGRDSGTVNACGYRLNMSLVTGSHGVQREFYTGLSTVFVGDIVRADSLGNSYPWNSTAFQKSTHTLLDFYLGFVPNDYQGTLRNQTPILLECLFQWCVKTLEASHQEGRLHEKVLATYIPPDAPEPLDIPDRRVNPLKSAPNDPFVMSAAGRRFSVGANMTRRMRNSLHANMPIALGSSDLDASNQYPGRWNFVQESPHNVNNVLGAMAEAVTNYIRGSTNEGTQQFQGDAWIKEPFVEVQWLWLLLPGTLLFGTLVLICGTIIRSKQKDVPAWKSSALATLLHGLTEESRQKIHVGASQSEVEKLSQKIRIVMSAEQRLVPVEPQPSSSRGGASMTAP